jgi:hypothetical protein
MSQSLRLAIANSPFSENRHCGSVSFAVVMPDHVDFSACAAQGIGRSECLDVSTIISGIPHHPSSRDDVAQLQTIEVKERPDFLTFARKPSCSHSAGHMCGKRKWPEIGDPPAY